MRTTIKAISKSTADDKITFTPSSLNDDDHHHHYLNYSKFNNNFSSSNGEYNVKNVLGLLDGVVDIIKTGQE